VPGVTQTVALNIVSAGEVRNADFVVSIGRNQIVLMRREQLEKKKKDKSTKKRSKEMRNKQGNKKVQVPGN
jgi:hypothetical protein